MARLPIISGTETIAALEKVGFLRHRQKGSHVAMVRQSPPVQTITVPLHKELAPVRCGPSSGRPD